MHSIYNDTEYITHPPITYIPKCNEFQGALLILIKNKVFFARNGNKFGIKIKPKLSVLHPRDLKGNPRSLTCRNPFKISQIQRCLVCSCPHALNIHFMCETILI